MCIYVVNCETVCVTGICRGKGIARCEDFNYCLYGTLYGKITYFKITMICECLCVHWNVEIHVGIRDGFPKNKCNGRNRRLADIECDRLDFTGLAGESVCVCFIEC